MSPRRRHRMRRKSGWRQFVHRHRRLLRFFLFLVSWSLCSLWGLPESANWLNENAEEAAQAMEATVVVFSNPIFGPDHVFLSLSLQFLAESEGISEDHLREIVAAAANVTERGKDEIFDDWLTRVQDLASLLLGLSKIESSYCRNIGGGSALEELEKRGDRAEDEGSDTSYWESNIRALNQIASQLRINVEDIPGSIGAGAISCFQMMPSSWLAYGGGDYRFSFQAAMNSARYLKAHGYPDSIETAVLSYNPNAGQEYVDDVLAARVIWQAPVTTAGIEPPLRLNVITFTMVYSEFLAWYIGDYQTAALGETGPFADFVNPYPGSHPTSYFWKDPVYAYNPAGSIKTNPNGDPIILILHPGQDLGGISGGQIVAAHPGRVTFARYLCPNSSDTLCIKTSDPALAAKWWISGVTVIIRGDLVLPDSSTTPVCTGYGHGRMGSLNVGVGDTVTAGQKIMDAGTTGFSTGVHLHFFVKIGGSGDFCDGGKFYNPNPYIASSEGG